MLGVIDEEEHASGGYGSMDWKSSTANKAGSSPTQRLVLRRSRFGMPMAERRYFPKKEENVKQEIRQNRHHAEFYYDRKERAQTDLEVVQPVFVEIKPACPEQPESTDAGQGRNHSINFRWGTGFNEQWFRRHLDRR